MKSFLTVNSDKINNICLFIVKFMTFNENSISMFNVIKNVQAAINSIN